MKNHEAYLISTEKLAECLDLNSPNLRIFDATVYLVPEPPGYKVVTGRQDYEKAHIPGAAFMDIVNDLSDATSHFNFTLPSAEHLQSAYRAAGINNDSQVVLYSAGHIMWATRAWWMLRSCGHKNIAVLDGGLAKWQHEERAMSKLEIVPPTPGDFSVQFNAAQWADKAGVLAAVDDGDICTINALLAESYSGEAKINYGRPGHIKNSQNIFYGELLNNGCFRSADEIKSVFTEKGVLDKTNVITYCGGGIAATVDALALSLIGHEHIAVYDGSMSEWAQDESLPLELGES